jgi:hypothetical protein
MKCSGEIYAFNDFVRFIKNRIPMAYPSDILIKNPDNFKMLNYFKRVVHNIGPVHDVTTPQESAQKCQHENQFKV